MNDIYLRKKMEKQMRSAHNHDDDYRKIKVGQKLYWQDKHKQYSSLVTQKTPFVIYMGKESITKNQIIMNEVTIL